MTARELYDIVKNWPVDARPEDVYYRAGEGGVYLNGVRLSPDHAALLFTAKGLEWLAKNYHNPSLCYSRDLEEPRRWIVTAGECYEDLTSTYAPTLLHAIDAAIRAVAAAERGAEG